MFFKDIRFLKYPKERHKVVFQCDEDYFKNYAFYNLISCDQVKHDVHIHFINVKEEFLEKVLKLDLTIDLSISVESLNTEINYYKLKSYYFTSRYFISDLLFEQNLIDSAYITDSDIIFNEHIPLPSEALGVLYYPGYINNLWKQTGANFLYVSKKRHDFIKKIISEYNKKLSETNFEIINEQMPKYERANLYALDQVCMSIVMQLEDTNSKDFLNLNSIDKFIGNKDTTCKIWSLTANKNENSRKALLERFKLVF